MTGKSDKFCHLHTHGSRSLLDGLSSTESLVKLASQDGQPALALTDHGNMYSLLDLYKEAKKHGVKPIPGVELYQAYEHRTERLRRAAGKNNIQDDTGGVAEGSRKQYYHLTALAEDQEGYKNLIQLSSRAFLEGYYQKPRVDWELLEQHSKGVIVTSGCLGGQVLQALVPERIMNPGSGRDDPFSEDERFNKAVEIAGRFQDIFGRDNFFIEVQNHGIGAQLWSNPHLVRIAEKINAPLLATQDSHYAHKEDHLAHDALLCVQTGAQISDQNRFRFDGTEHYFKSAAEMRYLFREIPSACDNTLWIAERSNVEIEFGTYHLPRFTIPEGYETDTDYLLSLTMEGAKMRWGAGLTDDIVDRLNFELKVIADMGFSSYFLIVWDLIRHAKENGIRVGPGRGSAAGSAVAYSLSITDLDPIKYDLLFERFLNPSRISMPDIDMDFDSRYRDEMIKYTRQKYGWDHVAQIITFAMVKGRSAVRDAARVLGMPYIVGDKIAKAMPPMVLGRDTPLYACMDITPKFEEGYKMAAELRDMYNVDPEVKQVVDVALGLESSYRSSGIHAAATVISDLPLTEYLPIQRVPEAGKNIEDSPIVTQFEMHGVEELGLLKMDFLGLRNLDVISDTVSHVKRTRGIDLVVEDIPLTDEKTFAMMQKSDTIGVFQLESPQMRNLIKALRPESFADISALVALYRPGPMAANMHNDYADRKNGRAPVEYLHPDAEDILKDTYGLMIYQESVMRIAQKFAGYTLAEADNLRKACLPRGSLMLTRSRGYVPIEQIMNLRDRRVQTIDTETANTRFDEVADVWSVGKKVVYRVTTSSGYTIDATADHPLFVEDEWRELGKVRPGDLLAVASRTVTNGGSRISDAEVDLAALLISEGYTPDFPNGANGVAHFCNTDPELLDTFRSAYHKHFGHAHNRSAVSGSTTQLRLTRVELLDLLPVLGTLGTSADKSISRVILNAPLRKVERFLGLYFCADGWADRSGAHFGSKSLDVVRGLKRLLLRCGITSNINQRTVGQHGIHYTLSIADKGHAKAFAAIVEPHLTQVKAAKVDRWLREWGDARSATNIGIPASFLAKELTRHVDVTGRSKRNLGVDTGSYEKCRVLHRQTLDGLLFSERLEDLRTGDLVWDTVVSVEEIGEEECFDFQMENPERPYALVGDVLVHNCGKKIRELIAKERVKFVDGCEANGYGRELGEEWFDIIEPFADYAFNKSHSYGYGLVSYQTAYLKANYPIEYYSALLTSVKSTLDKAGVYLNECRIHNIPVRVPDINRSMSDFEPVLNDDGTGEILFGLSAVRNVGEGLVALIVEEREKNGPYKDFYDFCERVEPSALNKRTLESLIKSGGFDCMGYSRKGLLSIFDKIVERVLARRRKEAEGQFELFAELNNDPSAGSDVARIQIPEAEFSKREKLVLEREMLGLYVSDHPLFGIDAVLRKRVDVGISELSNLEDGSFVRIGGLVAGLKRKYTKKGDLMAIFTLEDLVTSTEVVVFPKTMANVGDLLENDAVVIVKGRLDTSGEQMKFVAMEVDKVDVERLEDAPLRIKVPSRKNKPEDLAMLRQLIERYPGSSPVYVHLGDRVLALSDAYLVENCGALAAEVRILLGADAIIP
jgi:DNA-directed DNA polymerase III PolC